MSKKARDRKKQLRKQKRENRVDFYEKFKDITLQRTTPESYDGNKIVHEDTYSVFGDYSSKPKNQLIEEIRAKLTESDKETTDLFFDKINEEPILSAEELKKVIGDSKRKWNYI